VCVCVCMVLPVSACLPTFHLLELLPSFCVCARGCNSQTRSRGQTDVHTDMHMHSLSCLLCCTVTFTLTDKNANSNNHANKHTTRHCSKTRLPWHIQKPMDRRGLVTVHVPMAGTSLSFYYPREFPELPYEHCECSGRHALSTRAIAGCRHCVGGKITRGRRC
jgi:hypothetical protein